MNTRFVVKNENTLCYQNGSMGNLWGVLASTAGGHNPGNGAIHINPDLGDFVRQATVADFNYFRCSVQGYQIDADGNVVGD